MSDETVYEKSARRFFITLNDVTKYEDLKKYITTKKNFKAMASCLAGAPSTGHEHIHIAVWFKKPFKWTQQVGENIQEMKSQCGSLEYVSPEKQEGWQKYLDLINVEKIRAKKRTCAEIMSMDYEEAMKTLSLNQMLCYHKLKQFDAPVTVEQSYKPDVEVYYLYGPSGVGKTKFIYEKLIEKGYGPKYFDKVKYLNGFYVGQVGYSPDVCLLEEFRDSQMSASEFIRRV